MRFQQCIGAFATAVGITGLVLSGAVLGQAADEAQITGQPLLYVKGGKLQGCGIRFLGILLNQDLKTGRGLDASVNIWSTGVAAVKLLSYNINVGEMSAGSKPKATALDSFWIKAPGEDPTKPMDGRFHDSDDAGGKIYGVEFDVAASILKALLDDRPLTFGIQRTGERGERLYFGTIKMSAAEQEQAVQCLRDLAR